MESITLGSGNHPSIWKKDGKTEDYEVVKNVVLQCTDVNNNNNKFYSLELHKHTKHDSYRLFTHYGRTDDLVKTNAGQKECRYADKALVEKEYDKIVKAKIKKGYQQVNLLKSKLGSTKAQGQTAGEVDLTSAAVQEAPKLKVKKTDIVLHPKIISLVERIYAEAGQALTSKTNVKITADGFETPLGVLTNTQVNKGFDILSDIRQAIVAADKKILEQLSSQFYTTIPHRIGRSKSSIEAAKIDTIEKSDTIEETLQLMRDMLKINAGSGGNLFASSEVGKKYKALDAKLDFLDNDICREVGRALVASQSGQHGYNLAVDDVYVVEKNTEEFNPKKLDIRQLYHGTRSPNVVGILSRGLLLPNQSKRHGAVISGAMFGPAIYTSSTSTKSANYCGLGGDTKSRFMFIVDVALGKIKQYDTAQPQLRCPPVGYDSVMGVASVSTATWNRLVHEEYMIYNTNQHKLSYLVEFHANRK